jgi:hypothetical protein
MKKIIRLTESDLTRLVSKVLNEVSSDYDNILDIYNEFGMEGMTPTEIDFLKSGGNIGGNFRYNIPDDIMNIFGDVFRLLKQNNIPYKIEETWAPSFGMLRYIDTEYNEKLYNRLERMFPDSKDNIIPFVQNRDNERIFIYIINPEDYKDIVEFK